MNLKTTVLMAFAFPALIACISPKTKTSESKVAYTGSYDSHKYQNSTIEFALEMENDAKFRSRAELRNKCREAVRDHLDYKKSGNSQDDAIFMFDRIVGIAQANGEKRVNGGELFKGLCQYATANETNPMAMVGERTCVEDCSYIKEAKLAQLAGNGNSFYEKAPWDKKNKKEDKKKDNKKDNQKNEEKYYKDCKVIEREASHKSNTFGMDFVELQIKEVNNNDMGDARIKRIDEKTQIALFPENNKDLRIHFRAIVLDHSSQNNSEDFGVSGEIDLERGSCYTIEFSLDND